MVDAFRERLSGTGLHWRMTLAMAAGLFCWVLFSAGGVSYPILPFIPGGVALGVFFFLVRVKAQEEDLDTKCRDLAALGYVSGVSTGNYKVDELLSSVPEIVDSMLGSSAVALLLLDEKSRLLQVHSWANMALREDVHGRLKMGEGVCGTVAQWGHSLIVKDSGTDPLAAKFETYPCMTSMIAVPLRTKQRILGVLCIGKDRKGALNERIQERIRPLADEISLAIENARLNEQLATFYVGAIRALMQAVETLSPKGKGHSVRVARYCSLLARELGMSPKEVEIVTTAALLHDIGNMGVYENINLKPFGLTQADWQIMLGPFKAGLSILEPLSTQIPIVPIIYHHYERYDGKGFPEGLSRESIPIGSRILAICNAFDHLSADGAQVQSEGVDRAILELRELAGVYFDPELVRRFANKIRESSLSDLSCAAS